MNEQNDLAQADSSETAITSFQPMGFVDILDGMFSLYRSHFRLFFGLAVIYFGLGLATNFISMVTVLDPTSISAIVISGLATLASSLLVFMVAAAMAYASAQIYLDRDITPQTAFHQVWRRFLPYVGTTFLYYLTVVCLSITIIGLPFAIYFAFRWGLYTLPVLFEETTPRNALRRSTALVKGTWWRVCGISFAIMLIGLMIGFILQTSYALLFSWLTGELGNEEFGFLETLRRLFAPSPLDIGWAYYIIYTMGSLIISGLIMPITTVGYALLYFDLRIRKEAFDIEMQVTE